QAFGRTPSGLVCGNVALGAGPKCHRFCGIKFSFYALSAARLDRIAAVETSDAAFLRPAARFGESDRMERPQPHLAQLAGFLEPKNPALRAAGADLEIEPATVTVIAAPPRLRDGQGCQLSDRPRHLGMFSPTHSCTHPNWADRTD